MHKNAAEGKHLNYFKRVPIIKILSSEVSACD